MQALNSLPCVPRVPAALKSPASSLMEEPHVSGGARAGLESPPSRVWVPVMALKSPASAPGKPMLSRVKTSPGRFIVARWQPYRLITPYSAPYLSPLLLLLSGDVEPNPGPRSRLHRHPEEDCDVSSSTSQSGRNVRPRVDIPDAPSATPPLPRSSEALDEGGVFMQTNRDSDVVRLGASQTGTTRTAKLLPCPFATCVDAHRNMTLDTLVRHLGRSHPSHPTRNLGSYWALHLHPVSTLSPVWHNVHFLFEKKKTQATSCTARHPDPCIVSDADPTTTYARDGLRPTVPHIQPIHR